MCTLIAVVRQFEGWPLVVAANRDEVYRRPASPVHRWPGEPFVAPRDEAAGGTWLGVNASGLFVGVTNRFPAPKDETRESRGVLVLEALRAESARELHARLADLPPGRFNAFHLLYADGGDAFVTWSDGTTVRQQDLSAGTHVVTERSLGGDDQSRTERVREHLRGLDFSRPPDPEAMQGVLRLHGQPNPLAGTCVHVPQLGYGTRSSMVLLVPERLVDGHLYWAEGSPCTTPYTDESALLRSLHR